ncbi:D-amino acid dehydrogenase [Crenobacter luteus]|uniref:Amino acid dehydrogenase n=1 Tax=Crenobacter luteus TaxID=1452487 RepID=A0A161SAM6_9NEIS|nr:D-amino acid dehydrogenase [Crenobacter luteus]KZE32843.1 amino acid dehydrogenase [Crenobacter luteus]
MKVVVLGSGIVGVSTAWFLARDGHEVTVIDRACGPARETSFANGGQISVSQSEPWAQPDVPWKVLKWLFREDAPLLYRPMFDPAQWAFCLRFLNECRPSRAEANMRQILALGRFSRATFDLIRAETGLAFDHRERGIVSIFLSQQELDAAAHAAAVMAEFGVDKKVVSRDEMVAIEPALAGYSANVVGATYCESDQSGDVHRFTCGLAGLAEAAGVEFRFSTRVNALLAEGGDIAGVSVTGPDGAFATVTADAYVLALGSHSPLVARTAGLSLPIYPAKGYSATLPVIDAGAAPTASLTDESYKIVMSRLGERLRIAGTAELAGYSSTLNPVRCRLLVERARTIFPGACDWDAAQFWTGLRPATPGNVPLIGRTRYPRLWLNTGHGTLGWTEGPGSGRALAELIAGRDPGIAFHFQGC